MMKYQKIIKEDVYMGLKGFLFCKGRGCILIVDHLSIDMHFCINLRMEKKYYNDISTVY